MWRILAFDHCRAFFVLALLFTPPFSSPFRQAEAKKDALEQARLRKARVRRNSRRKSMLAQQQALLGACGGAALPPSNTHPPSSSDSNTNSSGVDTFPLASTPPPQPEAVAKELELLGLADLGPSVVSYWFQPPRVSESHSPELLRLLRTLATAKGRAAT